MVSQEQLFYVILDTDGTHSEIDILNTMIIIRIIRILIMMKITIRIIISMELITTETTKNVEQDYLKIIKFRS